jgi:hypothetical protein
MGYNSSKKNHLKNKRRKMQRVRRSKRKEGLNKRKA